ncbi:MAG: L-serine ammonia-lyase, partial [Bryobacteraceae bacterium]|nr:L-serine ammonia-lyase [Bryobacteraceae bacterium]
MKTSLFDLFRIGIGPSSSHTVGPMRAGLEFVTAVGTNGTIREVRRVTIDLYGSLALTGVGHGT